MTSMCFSWLVGPDTIRQRQANPCVAVVDPITTGAVLAAEFAQRGCQVVAVWSSELSEDLKQDHLPEAANKFQYYAEVTEQDSLDRTAAAVRAASNDLQLVACVVGAETGVRLADALSQELVLETNGTDTNRRDKSVQQQCVKAAGLRAVRECCGTEWSAVEAFVDGEPLPVVVKPVESAGSEGVKLCKTKDEAREHFELLMGSQLKLGNCGAVLVQEYLRGIEYVVDHVSLDGIHKTVMVWVYDKRPCNGADFVYFGMVPVASDSAIAQQLITYTRGVLDSIGFKNGPSHGEVMMTDEGPCLVEMNSRSHGGDGGWVPLARSLTGGYSQVDATIDACIDKDAFQQLPGVPPSPFKAYGQEVMLVCMRAGTIVGMSGFEKIRRMESFDRFFTDLDIGSKVELTVDLFTTLGSVFLMHEDAEVMAADLETIRKLEADGALFEMQEDRQRNALQPVEKQPQGRKLLLPASALGA